MMGGREKRERGMGNEMVARQSEQPITEANVNPQCSSYRAGLFVWDLNCAFGPKKGRAAEQEWMAKASGLLCCPRIESANVTAGYPDSIPLRPSQSARIALSIIDSIADRVEKNRTMTAEADTATKVLLHFEFLLIIL